MAPFGQGRTAAKRQNVGKPAHGETPREGSLTASDPHSEATSGHVGGPPAIALQKSGGPEVPGPNPGAPTNESPLGRSFLFPARQRDWLGGDAVATDHRRSRSERASRGGGRGARERPGGAWLSPSAERVSRRVDPAKAIRRPGSQVRPGSRQDHAARARDGPVRPARRGDCDAALAPPRREAPRRA
jgi:hypothetical protein